MVHKLAEEQTSQCLNEIIKPKIHSIHIKFTRDCLVFVSSSVHVLFISQKNLLPLNNFDARIDLRKLYDI